MWKKYKKAFIFWTGIAGNWTGKKEKTNTLENASFVPLDKKKQEWFFLLFFFWGGFCCWVLLSFVISSRSLSLSLSLSLSQVWFFFSKFVLARISGNWRTRIFILASFFSLFCVCSKTIGYIFLKGILLAWDSALKN